MTSRVLVGALLVPLAAVGIIACAAGDDGPDYGTNPIGGNGGAGGAATQCEDGDRVDCQCAGGEKGTRNCSDHGVWGPCECVGNGGQGGQGGHSGPDPCGDGMCIGDETCRSCKADCGECAPCDIAPECDADAMIPPPDVPHFDSMDSTLWLVAPEQIGARLAEQVASADEAMRVLAAALDPRPMPDEHPLVTRLREVFDDHQSAADIVRQQLAGAGMASPSTYRRSNPERKLSSLPEPSQPMSDEFPGGTVECGKPYLRVKIDKVIVHEEDDDWPLPGDEIYCIVQAEAGTGAEIRLTPLTPALDEGEEYQFSMGDGVFWGQLEPAHPGSHILVTYDCLESDSGTQGWQDLFDAIGDAATATGGAVGGDYGWVFTATGGVASIVSAGLALGSDDHLFNAQQTILLEDQLELTNGYYWRVRREGTHMFSDWDWELIIKAWGCAEFGTL